MEPDDARWVREVTRGEEVTGVQALEGGITSATHAFELDGRALVLRRIDKQPWLTHATELLTREAEVMGLPGVAWERLEGYVESSLRASSSRS